MNTEILVSFIFATATLAFSPGPDNVFVLVQTISYGKRKGMAIVVGLILGCIIHTSVVAFGLSSFIQSSPKLLFILKLIFEYSKSIYTFNEDFNTALLIRFTRAGPSYINPV